MNKLIKGILIGVSSILIIGVTVIQNLETNSIKWINAKEVEKTLSFTLDANSLDGDSLEFNFGTQTLVTGMSVRCRGNGTAYVAGTTDTIKFYGEYGDAVVTIGYIADTLFTTTEPLVSFTSFTTGVINGYNYSLGVADGKFTTGDMKYDCTLYLRERY